METKKLLSMLLSLGVAASTFAGFFTGESRKEYDQRNAKHDATLPQQLTLIGKRIQTRMGSYGADWSIARLYFDMDGNTNTTEIVARKKISCPTADARVFDAKIGDKKTIAQWRKELSHKGEDTCQRNNPHDCRDEHYFVWERVKE